MWVFAFKDDLQEKQKRILKKMYPILSFVVVEQYTCRSFIEKKYNVRSFVIAAFGKAP